MNPWCAFYWEMLTRGATPDQLVAATLDRFDGVDEAAARQDVQEFLDSVGFALDDGTANH